MKLKSHEVRFEVTNRCNASCIMCPREKMTRPQGILDIGLYKRILDEAAGMGAKIVTLENFGESFIDPYIFERAEYAKSKGLEVYTVTNGSLLDEEKIPEVLRLFDKIRISMYGMKKDTYEAIHKGLCYETVKNNVMNIFRMKRERNGKIKIHMYFLILKENRHEMREFLDQFENIADAVSVWKPHNWADARNYRPVFKKKVSCGRPFSGPLQIQWNGLLVPCCFDYDSKIVLGDLTKEVLADVLKGKCYAELREAHKKGGFHQFPLCDGCDQLNKREDVLVYTNIQNAKVGATYSTNFDLDTGNNG